MAYKILYTKAQALTEVRSRLNEITEHFWLDTEIDDWLDEGSRFVSSLTQCTSKVETLILLADTTEYQLSEANHFLAVEAVTYEEKGVGNTAVVRGLQKVTFETFSHVGSSAKSTPKYYDWFGNSVFIWPPPHADIVSVTADTITVYGYEVVDEYKANGSIPSPLQYLPVVYAISCANTKAGKHSVAGRMMQRFLAECSLHKAQGVDRVKQIDSRDTRRIPDYTVPAGS